MPSKKTKIQIPIHDLNQFKTGIKIHKIDFIHGTEHIKALELVHRDTYYLFYVQQTGSVAVSIDFKQIEIHGNALTYILPGQIHYGLDLNPLQAWAVAIDATLVDLKYKNQLESCLQLNIAQSLTQAQNELLVHYIMLFDKTLNYQQIHQHAKLITPALIDGFLNLFNQFYFDAYSDNSTTKENRTLELTRQFRALVRNQFRKQREPQAYAQQLHVSLSYLNDSVKTTTGFSLTYWIQQEIAIETKRLLYYTTKTIKEIAYELGFLDQTYFTRLFRKITGETPSDFRKKYRE